MTRFAIALLVLASVLALACATPASSPASTPVDRPPPFPLYEQLAEPADAPRAVRSGAVLVRGATVMTATGKSFANGHVLFIDGIITAVGDGAGTAPAGATIVDAPGMYVTPGIIDTHSHMGVYALPGTDGNDDGNEATRPTRGDVWAEHAFWPQDPALPRALAGGVTTIQVLPGSANLVGGRSFTAKLKVGRSAREMRFPNAPQGVKMACGENPKRVHGGGKGTRMGNVAGFRKLFADAADYRRRWQKWHRDVQLWRAKLDREAGAPPKRDGKGDDASAPLDPPDPPGRDLELETLAAVLDGKILVHNHCYRADEMSIMLDLAKQYGFKIRSFHHALEAYKIADRLAAEGTAVSTWADWWGFKMESYDGVPHNAAMLSAAGARAIIHSDSEVEIRHLNQEAAKAMTAGRQLGITVSDDEALRWVTANPAWALGIDGMTGTLAAGKMADVVLWDRNPMSVYAKAQKVWVDGELLFDRGKTMQRTDFELGTGVRAAGEPTGGKP